MHIRAIFLIAALFVTTTASSAGAATFTGLYAFGDSLSDQGNLSELSPGSCPPSPPYDDCKFSNGPTWVENVAGDLGFPSSPGFAGGNNYAVAGAVTGDLLTAQIPTFGAAVGGVADSGALYTIWAGGNDGLGSLSATDAADNIATAIMDLSVLGAENFLVLNLPAGAALGSFSPAFNSALSAGLSGISGVNIYELDIFALTIAIATDPPAFGFTNVVDPCFDGVTVCADPDAYLLWDAIHPTAAAHDIIADAALAVIPEPGTAVLVGMGLLILSVKRRHG